MGILMTTQKPTIEIEVKNIFGVYRDRYPTLKIMNILWSVEKETLSAIQNTMKNLKKKSFYAECSIPVDSGSPIKYRKLSVEWSDVEEKLGKVE